MTERRRHLLDLLPKRSVGVEIGVHEGDFSRVLLDAVQPERLHLVDPWRYEESPTYETSLYGGKVGGSQRAMDERCAAVRARFREQIEAGQVTVHRGDSAVILGTFPDDYFDWVYIDGNHLYEHVRDDLALSALKTKPGGLVTGDDYADGGWWQGGVKRAVDEFAAAGTMRLVTIENGQFVFEKPRPR